MSMVEVNGGNISLILKGISVVDLFWTNARGDYWSGSGKIEFWPRYPGPHTRTIFWSDITATYLDTDTHTHANTHAYLLMHIHSFTLPVGE